MRFLTCSTSAYLIFYFLLYLFIGEYNYLLENKSNWYNSQKVEERLGQLATLMQFPHIDDWKSMLLKIIQILIHSLAVDLLKEFTPVISK